MWQPKISNQIKYLSLLYTYNLCNLCYVCVLCITQKICHLFMSTTCSTGCFPTRRAGNLGVALCKKVITSCGHCEDDHFLYYNDSILFTPRSKQSLNCVPRQYWIIQDSMWYNFLFYDRKFIWEHNVLLVLLIVSQSSSIDFKVFFSKRIFFWQQNTVENYLL